jgi:2-polyprenyl-3-methyl-5-hydroxy-6-metoxy-1,4-benzoquinol methylase
MKFIDFVLQQWRIAKANSFIPNATRVLDIGCRDGELFRRLGGLIREGMGIDPELKTDTQVHGVPLIAGSFPDDMPEVEPFDVITMLAVLEHFPASGYANLSQDCARSLKPGGVLIITVPSPKVDYIIKVLKFFKLMDGMSLEQHHGYDVAQTTTVFSEDNFHLKRHIRFQLGLNNLFVFERNPITLGVSDVDEQAEDPLARQMLKAEYSQS